MLGPWRIHVHFQEQLEQQLIELLPQNKNQVEYHAGALEKVYIINLGPLKELVMSFYSSTGHPALNQPEISRALILASHYKESISSVVARLKANDILAIACGFETDSLPGIGSFYDFFHRFWLEHAPAKVVRDPYKKKKKKLKANEKLPPDNPDTADNLVEKVFGEETFEQGPVLAPR